MDEALGGKISDYLIKPVNPKQILLTIKKNIDTKRLVTEKTTSGYQSQFGQIGMQINTARSFEDWIEIYKIGLLGDGIGGKWCRRNGGGLRNAKNRS